MTAPGNFGQGVFPDGVTLALSDVMVAYRPGQIPGWSAYTIEQFGSIASPITAVDPTNFNINTGTLFLNDNLIINEGIVALGTANAFVAPSSAINVLGGELQVIDAGAPAQLVVGSFLSATTASAVVNSGSIVLNGTTSGVVANGPTGQIFMGPSSNALGGDWDMVGTLDATELLESGNAVLTAISTLAVVNSGAWLNAATLEAGDTITQKPGTFALPFSWGGGTVSAQTIDLGWAPQDFVITKMIGNLGTAGGSYNVAALNNGSTITGLGSVAISSTVIATGTATAGNTVTAGNPISIIVSGITSTPTGGAIQVQGTYTS